MNQISFSREEGVCTIRESDIFLFVRGIFDSDTNNYICIGWSPCSVQMPSHRGALAPSPIHPVQMPHICTRWWLRSVQIEASTFVPVRIGTNVRAAHLYRSEPPPCTNVSTFVPALASATTIFPFSSPCPSPLHHSSSSLQLELPLPNGALGSFCPICDDFSTIRIIEVA
jgi:hypothetical protein